MDLISRGTVRFQEDATEDQCTPAEVENGACDHADPRGLVSVPFWWVAKLPQVATTWLCQRAPSDTISHNVSQCWVARCRWTPVRAGQRNPFRAFRIPPLATCSAAP